jgi:hypothetical protein
MLVPQPLSGVNQTLPPVWRSTQDAGVRFSVACERQGGTCVPPLPSCRRVSFGSLDLFNLRDFGAAVLVDRRHYCPDFCSPFAFGIHDVDQALLLGDFRCNFVGVHLSSFLYLDLILAYTIKEVKKEKVTVLDPILRLGDGRVNCR